MPDPVYVDEIGIRASYSGKGRIAEEATADLRWVDGELLVFDPNSPIAGGAELGLVWNIPNKRRAYVTLHRIVLPESREVQESYL